MSLGALLAESTLRSFALQVINNPVTVVEAYYLHTNGQQAGCPNFKQTQPAEHKSLVSRIPATSALLWPQSGHHGTKRFDCTKPKPAAASTGNLLLAQRVVIYLIRTDRALETRQVSVNVGQRSPLLWGSERFGCSDPSLDPGGPETANPSVDEKCLRCQLWFPAWPLFLRLAPTQPLLGPLCAGLRSPLTCRSLAFYMRLCPITWRPYLLRIYSFCLHLQPASEPQKDK